MAHNEHGFNLVVVLITEYEQHLHGIIFASFLLQFASLLLLLPFMFQPTLFHATLAWVLVLLFWHSQLPRSTSDVFVAKWSGGHQRLYQFLPTPVSS